MPDSAVAEFATETGVIVYEWLNRNPARPAQDAPTLLLLHNFMSTGRAAWGRIADKIDPKFQVLLPDLPGHGQSTGYPPDFSYPAMARQMADLLAAEQIERVHLAGCSAGGMIAEWMVQERMVEVETLALVSSTYSVDPATTGVATSLDPADFKASSRWMETTARLHDVYQGSGYFDDVLLPGFRSVKARTAIDLPLSALHEWRMPVCLIHGEEDEIFPVEIARQMADALPDAELHLIPDQSHALIFSRPWQVEGLLRQFWAKHV